MLNGRATLQAVEQQMNTIESLVDDIKGAEKDLFQHHRLSV